MIVAAASDEADPRLGRRHRPGSRVQGRSWYPRDVSFSAVLKTLCSTGWDSRGAAVGCGRSAGVAASVRRPPAERRSWPRHLAARGGSSTPGQGGQTLRWVDAKTGRGGRFRARPVAKYSSSAPDGRTLAIGGAATTRSRRPCSTRELVKPSGGKWAKGKDPHSAKVEEFAFSADSQQLARRIPPGEVRCGNWTATPTTGPPGTGAYSATFHPDSHTAVTVGWDKKLRFWNPADECCKNTSSSRRRGKYPTSPV